MSDDFDQKDRSDYWEDLGRAIEDDLHARAHTGMYTGNADDVHAMFLRTMEKAAGVRRARVRRLSLVVKLAAGASVAAALLWFVMRVDAPKDLPLGVAGSGIADSGAGAVRAGTVAGGATAEVRPGKERAVLTLASGQTIQIDSLADRVVWQEGKASIAIKKGALVYFGEPGAAVQGTTPYNTITIPKGGSFRIVLSDGTKVHLNAATSMRFSTDFNKRKRIVELSGEAYFEVAAHAGMPFAVKAGGMDVNVLGTHFNVRAYANEPMMRTTLLEGKVQVRTGDQAKLLRPGQEAVVQNFVDRSDDERIQIENTNTDVAVAWTTGYFRFADSDLRSILAEVARWYDATVEYAADVNFHETYGGRISRDMELKDLLSLLEESGLAHFQVTGKKITVKR